MDLSLENELEDVERAFPTGRTKIDVLNGGTIASEREVISIENGLLSG